MGYNSFIKGGLPLNSSDFVDRENALANKSRLLVALDKISKLHNRQMQTYDKSTTANNLAVNKTIDAVTSSMSNDDFDFESITSQSLDSSPSGLWQAPAITEAPISANTDNTPSQGQELGNIFDFAKENPQSDYYQSQEPMFTNENAEPMYTNDDTSGYDSFSPNEMGENTDNQYESMSIQEEVGDPLYVLDEELVGKKGKKAKSTVTSNDVKGGRWVAWMAYIVFFLPLIFMGKNSFVRHHADNGLCYNLIDAVGVGLIFLDKIKYFEESNNKWVALAIMLATILGFMIVALMALIKVVSILISWAGREVKNPVLNKFNVIK